MLADAGRVIIEQNRRVADVFTQRGIAAPAYVPLPPAPPLCFMHIPKTGGASAILWLQSMFPADEVAPCRNTVDFEALEGRRHSYRLFAGHFLGRQARLFPAGAQWITVLRDPVEMAVSAYHHRRLAPPDDWEADRAELAPGDPLRGDDSTDKRLAMRMSELFRTADLLSLVRMPRMGVRAFFRDTLVRRFGATAQEERVAVRFDDRAPELAIIRRKQFRRAVRLLDRIDLVGDHSALGDFLLLVAATRGWSAPPQLARIHDFGAPTREDSASPELREHFRRYSPADEKLYVRAKARSQQVQARLEQLCGGTTSDCVNALHRRRVFLETPVVIGFDVTAEEAWNGCGWGVRERDGMRNAYREFADGRSASILARLDPAIAEYRLFAHVLDASSQAVLDGLAVHISGAALDRVDTAWRHGALILEWRVPAGLIISTRGQIEFVFSKDDATRHDSIRLSRIGCVPALTYA